MMAETTDVEVELYEENVGTPYSTSDEMDNSRTIRMQVPFKEPTHNSLQETTSELQKCSGPFRNTLRSLAGDVNCEMPIEAGPGSAHYCIDSNQILHSDKDHQMPFVGGHDTRITKSNRHLGKIKK